MKNLFIPYELAVIAKEKGFNKPCFGEYGKRRENEFLVIAGEENIKDDWYESICNAPIYQQIVDWLAIKHNKFIVYSPINKEVLNREIEEAFKLI